ncbi:hypothetical protein [cf. Phormidesmis sp. LEGE 11477]|uniref:hypothetical protein n=1 Tax=cf. Phormidesmis sp. LEGE 11477 TaxID=1828680 RepID=UPI0018808624|nr:hypothetical protein [cf. Phormidesmis sp. LEGE 11477]MBE9059605.1 hypothetical protein [cf. Phormidesmis sp. LEGE 11477]
MEQFNLLDRVRLLEPVPLKSGFDNALTVADRAPIGTVGTIVEVLEPAQVFLVELFGDWVKLEAEGLRRAAASEEGAFRETLGVEVVKRQQMILLKRADVVKVGLFRLLDEMPEELLEEVQTFAESLSYRHQEMSKPMEPTG